MAVTVSRLLYVTPLYTINSCQRNATATVTFPHTVAHLRVDPEHPILKPLLPTEIKISTCIARLRKSASIYLLYAILHCDYPLFVYTLLVC